MILFFRSYFFDSLPRNSTSAQTSVLTHPLALAVNESLACVQPPSPLQQKGAEATTTATKMSLKKRIRAASNFIALIPSRLIRQMLANFCGVELYRTVLKFRKRKRKLLFCVPFLDKTRN